jgi:hypothetical protein
LKGFHEVAMKGVFVLEDIIFRDIKEALEKIFTKAW